VYNTFLLLMKSANIDNDDNNNANDDKNSNNNNMGDSNDSRHFVLDNEEPLSVIFQRAVVLQRSGDHESALKEYQFFIKAAEGCDVSPSMYAEVHVNIGAVYAKDNANLELAKHHFELAIGYRPDNMGTAYVNLALLALRKGSSIGADNPEIGIQCLEEAESYLNFAINQKDDSNNNVNNNESSESDDDDDELQQPSTKTTALRLLEDVHAIMGQMKIRE
jgi:tetratricopeptide (TPR) repeat protein